MTGPKRIQLKRIKGWRMPENTVKVDRSTRFGNPFNFRDPSHCWTALSYGELGNAAGRQAASVKAFQEWITSPHGMMIDGVGLYIGDQPIAVSPIAKAGTPPDLSELRGKNLGCWCHLCPRYSDGKPLDEDCADCAPCHVDPLGRIANAIDQVPA